MSLVVCLKAQGGIVLGADSRGTIGDPRGLTAINDTQIKIYPLGNCGIGLVGAGEMGNQLMDVFRKNGSAGWVGVDVAIQNVIRLAADGFSTWFAGITHEKRPGVLLTVAGYRKSQTGESEALIYQLSSQLNFAPSLSNHTALSGVPQYAVYLQHRYYDPSISLAKARALAEYIISETASQDPKVGGPIRMAEIKPDSGYKELDSTEVKAISEENKELNQELRQFFLKGDKK